MRHFPYPRAAFGVATAAFVLLTTSTQAQSRAERRAKAEKMNALDAQIEARRAAAPIPDEGTTDMNGVDLHKKRQLEIVEARLNASSSLAAKPSEKDNQYETNSRAFSVRKFKPTKGGHQEQRGWAPPARGIDPEGEPLDKKQRKFFLRQR